MNDSLRQELEKLAWIEYIVNADLGERPLTRKIIEKLVRRTTRKEVAQIVDGKESEQSPQPVVVKPVV